jgi:hypothetical protein
MVVAHMAGCMVAQKAVTLKLSRKDAKE